MKIGTMMQVNPLKHAHNQNFDLLKIQDCGWPPFCKIKKLPYLRNGLINLHQLLHGDAH